MVQYKLTYFNMRGRAELSRLILHHAQIPFDYIRIERADWPHHKQNTPFGQFPILEVDGKVLAQSKTIARYLAGQHGLGGNTDFEKAQSDLCVENVYDLIVVLRPLLFVGDPDKRKELFDKVHTETIMPHLEKVEAHLIKNGTGFLVGDSITWADFAYFTILDPIVEIYGESTIEKIPHLTQLIHHINNIPQIKKYNDNIRPKIKR